MLVTILVLLLVASLVYYIITILPLPAPFKNIALAILAIVAIIYLLGFIEGSPLYLHR